jgi:hypothetical protein
VIVSPQPSVLFGVKGIGDANGHGSTAPGGADTVCTEAAIDAYDGQWSCLAWAINAQHLAVVTPRAYSGACAHLVIDQERGQWTCLSGTPPPPGSVPPVQPAVPTPGA